MVDDSSSQQLSVLASRRLPPSSPSTAPFSFSSRLSHLPSLFFSLFNSPLLTAFSFPFQPLCSARPTLRVSRLAFADSSKQTQPTATPSPRPSSPARARRRSQAGSRDTCGRLRATATRPMELVGRSRQRRRTRTCPRATRRESSLPMRSRLWLIRRRLWPFNHEEVEIDCMHRLEESPVQCTPGAPSVRPLRFSLVAHGSLTWLD